MPVSVSRGDEAYWARRVPVLAHQKPFVYRQEDFPPLSVVVRQVISEFEGNAARCASSHLPGDSAGNSILSQTLRILTESGSSNAELSNASYVAGVANLCDSLSQSDNSPNATAITELLDQITKPTSTVHNPNVDRKSLTFMGLPVELKVRVFSFLTPFHCNVQKECQDLLLSGKAISHMAQQEIFLATIQQLTNFENSHA